MTPEFKKFTSIENFAAMHHALKKLVFVADRPTVNYRGKIKLHGTNAGIRVVRASDGLVSVFPMKRTSFITPQNDNCGFAKWVEERKGQFGHVLNSRLKEMDDLTIFGEWAGPGIQRKDAVTQISVKTFFVFAIRVENIYITSPSTLKLMLSNIEGVKILPWSTPEFKVDLSKSVDISNFLDKVNSLVDECGKCDPFIKETFAIEGPGEGYVFYPQDEWGGDAISSDEFFFVFKAKTEAHSQSGNKTKAAEVDPILHDNAAKFASEYVTDARMSQALSETGVVLENASASDTGKILKWIGQDVMKESVASLEVSGMEWHQVAKAVNAQARNMFFKLLENS